DPKLQGSTQSDAQILDHSVVLNPINNYFFTMTSSLLIIPLGWLITDRFVEPKLQRQAQREDIDISRSMDPLTAVERKALRMALLSMLVGLAIVVATALPQDSAWRGSTGSLTEFGAPLMASIVALIFVFFLLPGVVYGVIA